MNNMVINVLERSLEASAMRQKAVANNIANADTPFYKAKTVAFEDVLRDALSPKSSFEGTRTDPRHIQIGAGPSLPHAFQVQDNTTTIANNGNNVDMDYEMSQLSKNSIWYNALVQQMNTQFDLLKLAIKGRE